MSFQITTSWPECQHCGRRGAEARIEEDGTWACEPCALWAWEPTPAPRVYMHRLRLHGDLGIKLPEGVTPGQAEEKIRALLVREGLDLWPDEELAGVEEHAVEWQGATEMSP